VVKNVAVAGQVLVESGQHIHARQIREEYIKAMREIWA
jgi:hypothetical protein